MHRAFHRQALEVRQRRFPKHVVHAARQRSLAGADGSRRLVQGKAARQPRARPRFESLHDGVGVDEMIGQRICRLRWPRIDDEISRRERGKLRTDSPHQPQRQIDVTTRGSGGDETSGLHDHVRVVE